MRRVLLAIGGTIAGLVALLSFKSHSGAGLPSAAASAGVTPSASAPPASSPAPAGSSPAASAGSSPGPAASSPQPAKTVLTGKVVQTADGPMQVQVTLVGHRITAVTVLQHTDNGTNSELIDSRAIPQLNHETLAAQSAKIDAVSGASYTSEGYIQSLQSALDKE
jgi:uncharacterized protein with FMN-binding domain